MDGERAKRKALARHGPAHLASQHDRRLVCATSWGTKTLLWWFADHALQALPPPADGLRSLVGDSTLKGQRGAKPPVAQNTRLSQHHPSVFGVRMVLLMAQWGVSRIPVDFAVVRRTDEPGSQPDNALLRQMLQDFRPPAWGQEGMVIGDAASASRPHMARLQELGDWSVLALPRTWNFTPGKPLTALVTHLPRWGYSRICLPTIRGHRRRTSWVYAKRGRLRHVGDVTVVLSQCRRHDGPKPTNTLVTHLPELVTERQIVAL